MTTPKKNKQPSKKKKKTSPNLFGPLRRSLLQFMSGRSYHPQSFAELLEKIPLANENRALFQDVLDELIKDELICLKHNRYCLPGSVPQIVAQGIIRMHTRGFGFLQPQEGSGIDSEIFIPRHLAKNAVDGDLVEVLVDPTEFSPKGPEGRVVTILKRGRTHIAGTVSGEKSNHSFYVHVPLLGTSRTVIVKVSDEETLAVGERLVMKVIEWGQGSEDPVRCELSHKIGHVDDPATDISAAIEEFDLRDDFAQAALQEALHFGPKVTTKEIKGRTDLRSLECFTIDPDTAKDFDDALSLTVDEKGGFLLGVHIADVSHYVKEGSHLDTEAKLRCNSTYFPGFCLPMLPHELSSHLCSLKPKVNRLTISVMMRFNSEGTLLSEEIMRSVIHSKKRFTYKEAFAVLQDRKTSPYKKTLKQMVELCHLLKKKRHERGSVEFALAETIVKIDSKGVPTGLERIEYDISHQLVEEFMLKANETIATHLSLKDKMVTFRVHEEPSPDNLKEFAQLARSLGFKISSQPTNQEIQTLFDVASSSPFASQLAVSYIRSMRLAYYSPANIGHYGLSLEYYCHFTSPIRRYVDLVVHRILCGESHDIMQLQQICDRCSEQERISAKAEQHVVLLKKLRLLNQNPQKSHRALITKVKGMGLLFEVQPFNIEGFLHISEIGQDYFIYNEQTQTLTGRHTGKTYRNGEELNVVLESLNLITLECKWRIKDQSVRTSNKRKKK